MRGKECGSLPWYQVLFDGDYLRLWASSLTAERTVAEVEGVVRLLELQPGARILDLCCGHGRHTIPLAALGFRLWGQDLSQLFLEQARHSALEGGVKVEWVHSDMREIPFEDEFDVILNLFSAFGYFESEADDLAVLQSVARALKPGGRFLLECGHHEALVRRFQPASISREPDGTVVLQERTFDLRTGKVDTLMTALWPDGRQSEHRFCVRSYPLCDLARMLELAGLNVVGYYGGLDASPLTLDSRRLAVIAERPVE